VAAAVGVSALTHVISHSWNIARPALGLLFTITGALTPVMSHLGFNVGLGHWPTPQGVPRAEKHNHCSQGEPRQARSNRHR
jgi:hypothetical protein